MTKLSAEEIARIISDRKLRVATAKQSHLWFDMLYFPHYFQYDFAPFHYQFFDIADHPEYKQVVIMAFRGSGKSTIATTTYPLYALFGKPQKKLIVIISQTAELAKAHLNHIKSELESNQLLKRDLGPFREVDNTWNSQAIVLPQQDAMIKAVSIDQSIRGFRYKEHRPDLIICDDLEDSQSVITEEGRKKTQQMFSSEIVPLGDLGTQIVMVGNYLHPNSLLSKVRKEIQSGAIKGKELFIPLVDSDNYVTWPQKFTTPELVYELQASVNDDFIWNREYLLRTIVDHDHFYTFENMSFYDEVPKGWEPYFQYRIAGVDLAISESENADYTAIVTADVYKVGDIYHVFILPNPFCERIGFVETYDLVKERTGSEDDVTFMYVESTGYQRALVELLQSGDALPIFPVDVTGMSKRERLSLTVPWNEKKQIHFPTDRAEALVNQLIGFGYESHDDLMDAFTLLVKQVQELVKKDIKPRDPRIPTVQVIKNAWVRPGVEYGDLDRHRGSGMGAFMSGLQSVSSGAKWGR